MKKTHWWRGLLSIFLVLILFFSYFVFCDEQIKRCLWGNNIIFVRTIFHFSLSLLVVSLPLFFVRDDVFRRWSRFAFVWMIVSAFLIAITPEYSGGWSGNYNPNREQVSVWLAILFPIVSAIKLIRDSRSK